MEETRYCRVQRDQHSQLVLSQINRFWKANELTDVTLLTQDGSMIQAHKLVLAASSTYFRKIFQQCPAQNPIIVCGGKHFEELESIVKFIYEGENQLREDHLQGFRQACNEFEILLPDNIIEIEPIERMKQESGTVSKKNGGGGGGGRQQQQKQPVVKRKRPPKKSNEAFENGAYQRELQELLLRMPVPTQIPSTTTSSPLESPLNLSKPPESRSASVSSGSSFSWSSEGGGGGGGEGAIKPSTTIFEEDREENEDNSSEESSNEQQRNNEDLLDHPEVNSILDGSNTREHQDVKDSLTPDPTPEESKSSSGSIRVKVESYSRDGVQEISGISSSNRNDPEPEVPESDVGNKSLAEKVEAGNEDLVENDETQPSSSIEPEIGANSQADGKKMEMTAGTVSLDETKVKIGRTRTRPTLNPFPFAPPSHLVSNIFSDVYRNLLASQDEGNKILMRNTNPDQGVKVYPKHANNPQSLIDSTSMSVANKEPKKPAKLRAKTQQTPSKFPPFKHLLLDHSNSQPRPRNSLFRPPTLSSTQIQSSSQQNHYANLLKSFMPQYSVPPPTKKPKICTVTSSSSSTGINNSNPYSLPEISLSQIKPEWFYHPSNTATNLLSNNNDSLTITKQAPSQSESSSSTPGDPRLPKMKKGSQYCCPVCPKEFIYRKAYEDHCISHNAYVSCPVCRRQYTSQGYLDRHLETSKCAARMGAI